MLEVHLLLQLLPFDAGGESVRTRRQPWRRANLGESGFAVGAGRAAEQREQGDRTAEQASPSGTAMAPGAVAAGWGLFLADDDLGDLPARGLVDHR
jgi:hypothetical protein